MFFLVLSFKIICCIVQIASQRQNEKYAFDTPPLEMSFIFIQKFGSSFSFVGQTNSMWHSWTPLFPKTLKSQIWKLLICIINKNAKNLNHALNSILQNRKNGIIKKCNFPYIFLFWLNTRYFVFREFRR